MDESIDWHFGADHMFVTHGVTVDEAEEAIADPDRVMIAPDYNSRSGDSDRIIGYSPIFGDLLTVIIVRDGSRSYGANGWRANAKDRRIYASGR